MIGIARPTRGIEFAESTQSIERNLEGIPWVTERSWDKKIPDSFNYVVDKLLARPSVEAIWFVEEDTVVPGGGFDALARDGADIIHLPQWLKLGNHNISYRRDRQGGIIWMGLGCTLVKREVFSRLERPWFRTGLTVGSVHEGSSCKQKTLQLVKSPWRDYGGQDIYFCWAARVLGLQLAVVPNMMADHLVLDALGTPYSNDGCHKIRRVTPRGGIQ